MKIYRIKAEYLVDDKYEDLADYLQRNNMIAENEFFDNCSQLCSKCGVTLNLDEEIEDGKCLQCSGAGEE